MKSMARLSLCSMTAPSLEKDHERRFQPSPEALESFLHAVRPWMANRIYDVQRPFAFTRTTYLDTAGLDLLESCQSGQLLRLRLREYAATGDLTRPAVLSGERFLELKRSVGARRTKVRLPISKDEAEALLTHGHLTVGSAAAELLRQASPAPVRPWVTAWYRRSTLATPNASIRVTLDEELVFGLPPEHSEAGRPAAPARLLGHAPPSTLLEVKWHQHAPAWLRVQLQTLESCEMLSSKFEQGMHARLSNVCTTQ